MKGITGIFMMGIALLTLGSCKDEPLMESPDVEQGMTLFEGSFQSAAHDTKGTVKIESDGAKTYVALSNFETDNGPDLFVYLSTDQSDSEIINLGELKSTSGEFFYETDANVDFEKYDHVLIWCKKFSVLFGYAELK